jgi:8-amino-7-oxononanoate synthase
MLENSARSLMFATALPPASAAAAAAALQIMKDEPALVKKPVENARRFTALLGREPAQSPIVPVIVGEADRALEASSLLERHGFLVVAIRPPSVPQGTARLRFAFSAQHEPHQIERVAMRLKEHGYA